MATRAVGGLSQRLAARDGFRRGLGLGFATECGAQKHDRENRPHGGMSSLHQFVTPRRHHSATPCWRERHVVSLQARSATQSEIAGGLSRMKLRFENAGSNVQICSAPSAKTDIDWFWR